MPTSAYQGARARLENRLYGGSANDRQLYRQYFVKSKEGNFVFDAFSYLESVKAEKIGWVDSVAADLLVDYFKANYISPWKFLQSIVMLSVWNVKDAFQPYLFHHIDITSQNYTAWVDFVETDASDMIFDLEVRELLLAIKNKQYDGRNNEWIDYWHSNVSPKVLRDKIYGVGWNEDDFVSNAIKHISRTTFDLAFNEEIRGATEAFMADVMEEEDDSDLLDKVEKLEADSEPAAKMPRRE